MRCAPTPAPLALASLASALLASGCDPTARALDDGRPTPAPAEPPAEPPAPSVEAAPVAAPCPPEADWPDGMACVRGGRFTLGAEDGRPDERAPGPVFVSTFYMDRTEVTNEAYEGCIDAGRCERPIPFRRFMGPRQPVVAVSWYDAVAYCELHGRRLPTEAEWERAASGPEHTRFPWGDEVPEDVCALANVEVPGKGKGCGHDRTRDVGAYPAGHWGLFDMAGNVHEWVADHYAECLRGCRRACGDACFGADPRGPCDGDARCPGFGLRSVRGGSWYWPLERARTTARRGSGAPNRGPHRFGFRCARDLVAASPPSDPSP